MTPGGWWKVALEDESMKYFIITTCHPTRCSVSVKTKHDETTDNQDTKSKRYVLPP